MKPIAEIVETKEFKIQAFNNAINSYSRNNPGNQFLYRDSFTNRIIIQNINDNHPRIPYSEIAVFKNYDFLNDRDIVDEKFKQNLEEIRTELKKVMTDFEYEETFAINFRSILDAYGFADANEMWSCEEFVNAIHERENQIIKRLNPIETLVENL